jgi:hypothetical protein
VGEPLPVRRLLSVVLVVAAALADASSAPGLAFYALVTAVPLTALAALDAYGNVLDAEQPDTLARLQAALWALVLALVVVGAAARAPALGGDGVPGLGTSALVGCLLVFLLQAVATGVAFFREPVALTRRSVGR